MRVVVGANVEKQEVMGFFRRATRGSSLEIKM